MSKEVGIPQEIILSKIYEIRGQKVMLDSDLAELYGVETKRLKEQVKRNSVRFPEKYMFELTKEEAEVLRSQIATSNTGRGGTRYLPMVFTEHGVLQLSNFLRSDKAIQMGFLIIDVFVKVRETLLENTELFSQMEEIRNKVSGQEEQITLIFEYLKQFEQAKQQDLEQKQRSKIGFKKKK